MSIKISHPRDDICIDFSKSTINCTLLVFCEKYINTYFIFLTHSFLFYLITFNFSFLFFFINFSLTQCVYFLFSKNINYCLNELFNLLWVNKWLWAERVNILSSIIITFVLTFNTYKEMSHCQAHSYFWPFDYFKFCFNFCVPSLSKLILEFNLNLQFIFNIILN